MAGRALPVDALAVGAIASGLLAAAELAQARGAGRPRVTLSGEHAAPSFTSERHALLRGAPAGAGFAPLSRLVRCRDGWARTHANYPHHARALGRALAIDPAAEPAEAVAALERAAASMEATELEEAAFAAGGCATALRSAREWARHPAGRVAGEAPLIGFEDGLRAVSPRPLGAGAQALAPARGVRVLDLTRVIAGPVAGRTLAALGAEVLRVDPPAPAELAAQHLDTGPGKRSAVLDLADAGRREALLREADVLLTGYRPGSLAGFGMSCEELAARHPQLVQVSLSAWGARGPWGGRRGFDSLVQVACGIAHECSSAEGVPGVLPAQALDHASGHLMAAAALRGLAARARGEPFAPARVSLATTAAALLRAPRPLEATDERSGRADPARHRIAFGELELIAPPGALDGRPLGWTHGPRPLGGDEPAWPRGAPR